jgi:hypothetical protein
MRSKHKTWLAVSVLLVAICVWGRWLWQPSPPDEESLRKTAGIEVTALRLERADSGFRVACRISNHRPQLAEQVVFQVSLMTSNGAIVAVNPLAAASAIPANESREVVVLVPTAVAAPDVTAKAQTSLVRWRD